ncbi:MAG: hypothetical protein H0U16_09270, partial [Actinobacteria bacterium]|nr:hypothetical protein [Actinomycetota bacterium]
MSDTAALDYHRLLSDLGARPLDIVEYFRVQAIPAAQVGRISSDEATELIKLIARHHDQLAGLRTSLGEVDLVPCQDGDLHPATEVHLPSQEISALAPDLPVAVTTGLQASILEWLGVQRRPSDSALAVAAQRLAQEAEGADPAVAEALLRTLQVRESLPDNPPEFLTAQPWLPVRRGGRACPRDVLPTNARHLYGAQGNELGLPVGAQGRYFSLLEWLGMPASPPLATVVAHLRHCVESETEMSPEVYRVLSDNIDQSMIRHLEDIACIQVAPGRFVEPARVFWKPTPLGRWCRTMPADSGQQGRYRPFFDLVGVKNEPGPAEIESVLKAIQNEFGTNRVDEQAEAAIHACWVRLSELLAYPDTNSVLETLGRTRSTLDPRGLMMRPNELFFEDSRALHKRFPRLAHNVIPRVHGTWPALSHAGVRRVDELIRAKLVDVQAEVDTELSSKIADRVSALRRVLDDQVVDELLDLTILRTPDLRVVYRAELFGHSDKLDPESVDAIYVSEEDELVYVDRASDRALARELSRAIAPDQDPGSLAMKLEPILGASSTDEAHHALDEFGIAGLEVTEHEVAWSPTADPGKHSD